MSPLTCSLAAHIACLEADLPVTLRRVDRMTKRLDDGADYRAIAPLGIVPALATGDLVLTEMAAVLQWIADRAPHKQLAPRWGSDERYALIGWIHFVSTELHKKHLWMVFSLNTPAAVKDWAASDASVPLAHVARHLDAHAHLLGDAFSVADAYLYWALRIAPHAGLDLTPWPALGRYVAAIQRRPAVRAALAIEVPMFQDEPEATRPARREPAPVG